jgi:hypothetical protein
MTIQASSWITSKTSWTAGTKLGGRDENECEENFLCGIDNVDG